MNQEQLQETEKLLTYSEWNAKGFRVHRGAKARGFKDKKALFGVSDTYKPQDWLKTSSRLGLSEPGEWADMPH